MIIEMRTYTLQPGHGCQFEERFGEALPARAKLSPLAAFWHTEVGPLNRVIHVWPYKDFEERTRVRAESQKLQGWPPNTREFVVEQQSEIFLPAPFSPKLEPRQLGGLYEIRTYTLKPGGIPGVIDRWSTRSPSASSCRRWPAPGTRNSAGSTDGATSGRTRTRPSASRSAKRPASEGIWPPKGGQPGMTLEAGEHAGGSGRLLAVALTARFGDGAASRGAVAFSAGPARLALGTGKATLGFVSPGGTSMLVMDVIAEILKREGISTLFCFPTTPIIEAAAAVGIKPVICRQERVGVHMADGFARVSNGRPPGVFAMQYGPGRRERVCRRRDGLFGFEPGGVSAARPSARDGAAVPDVQIEPLLRLDHQIGRGGHSARAGRQRHAPRLQPGEERAARAGHGRGAGRCRRRRSRGRPGANTGRFASSRSAADERDIDEAAAHAARRRPAR